MITRPRPFAALIAATLQVAAVVAAAEAASAQEATPPSGPPSAELAKKCLAPAVKAHPVPPAGSNRSGYAQAQRLYFKDCIARNGNMSN